MPEMFILIAVAGVLLVGGMIWLSVWMERKKREAMQALAAKLGFAYQPGRDRDLARRYEFLTGLKTGSNRYASHVLTGSSAGHRLMAFEHHHETTSTDSKGNTTTHHHYHSVFVLELPRAFPRLTIQPEGIFSKIAQAFGYDDIDFESAEFSRAFCVRSADKKFAYDVCHPQAIELLMKTPGEGVEIEGTTLAAVYGGALSATEVEGRLGRLVAFWKLMPEYLLVAVA